MTATDLGPVVACPVCRHGVRLHGDVGCTRGDCECSMSRADLGSATPVQAEVSVAPSGRTLELLDPACARCTHRRGRHAQQGYSVPCSRCACRNFTTEAADAPAAPPAEATPPPAVAAPAPAAPAAEAGNVAEAPRPAGPATREREEALQESGRLRARVEELEAPRGPDIHYLLWSGKHSCWWRPDGRGYTSDATEAGRYTEHEAVGLVVASSLCGVREHVTSMVAAPESWTASRG